jgi:hypothetical protein
MEDDTSPEPARQASSYKWPPEPVRPLSNTEFRLRRLIGRRGIPYDGQIVAITRGWVSRDSKRPAFAARYLDFAVLTHEHLMFCSTGFFSRQPRRGVFREPLTRLVVVDLGAEPMRKLRIVGDFSRPLIFELRNDDESIVFAKALLDTTRTEARPAPTKPETTDSEVESNAPEPVPEAVPATEPLSAAEPVNAAGATSPPEADIEAASTTKPEPAARVASKPKRSS